MRGCKLKGVILGLGNGMGCVWLRCYSIGMVESWGGYGLKGRVMGIKKEMGMGM